jgi:hypothetical protein
MKPLNRLLKSILLAVLIYCCNTIIIIGQSNEAKWSYPLRPGMPEWASLKTDIDKFNACQIPEDIIDTISAADLLELCIDYPLFYTIYHSDNYLIAFQKLKEFNGIHKLFSLKDVGETLLLKYENTSPASYLEDWGNLRKGTFALKISHLELFISSYEIIFGLNRKQVYFFIKEARRVYNEKRGNPDIYSSYSVMPTINILISLLKYDNPEMYFPDYSLEDLIKSNTYVDRINEQKIMDLVDNYLKQNSVNYEISK